MFLWEVPSLICMLNVGLTMMRAMCLKKYMNEMLSYGLQLFVDCAQNGHGHEALKFFNAVKHAYVKPNASLF
jgi:hypothetical protein